MLPIGLLLHSISSNFCACIFTWSCFTRTELVQKWSLLVRIRTIVDRISICFFEPRDLLFRSDSGKMEEDLDAVQHVQLNQIIFALEDLLEQHAQPKILLINVLLNEIFKDQDSSKITGIWQRRIWYWFYKSNFLYYQYCSQSIVFWFYHSFSIFEKQLFLDISINGHKECTLFLRLPKSIMISLKWTFS